jgi:acetyl-CoA synthetase
MYTSGTSGSPKGVVHANRVLLGHAGVDFAFELFEPGDVYYGTADWGWVGGLMLGLLVPWSFGVPVVAFRQQKFDPAATLAVLERYGVTVAFLPPSVLRLLAAHGQRPRRRLRAVVTGGEPAGRAEMTWSRRYLSASVNKAFGQTEANGLIGDSVVLGSVDDATMGAPYPGHTVRLLDEAGNEVAPGEVGEIALRLPDPVAMLGIWSSELGAAVPVTEEWHRTGDLARRVFGQRLEYLGRADDVIKSRGYRIGPGEIEQALKLHPAVADAAVVGVPDPEIGQFIRAFVQLDHAELDATLVGTLRDLVATTVGPHAKPRDIESIDAMPRTELGKLLRRELPTHA